MEKIFGGVFCVYMTAVIIQCRGADITSAARRQGFSQRITIGVIYDSKSEVIHSAFRYKLAKFNKEQSRLKLEANAIKLERNDAYTVSNTICNLMKRGIFAIFGVHHMNTIHMIKSCTSTFRMPYLTPSMPVNTSGQQLGYEIYLRPFYARAVVDIIRHYRWREVWYVYNTDDGLMRIQQLFDALAEGRHVLKTNVLRVRDAEDAHLTLIDIDAKRSDEKRIILDMDVAESEKLLERELNTSRTQHHFFMIGIGLNEMNIKAFNHGGMNITGIRLVDNTDPNVASTVNNWSTEDKILTGNPWKKHWYSKHQAPHTGEKKVFEYQAALAMDAVDLIAGALVRMIDNNPNVFENTLKKGKVYNNNTEGIDCDAVPVVPWQHGYDIMKAMRETQFSGISGRISFDKFGFRRNFRLEILEVNLNRGLARIGFWYDHLQRGLKIQNPSLVRYKGNNTITNKTRIVTSILTAPYLMLRIESQRSSKELTGNDKYEGYCADLAKKIADIVTFDYKIEPVKDGKYGSRDEDGSWNGMVGELIRHEADLAIAPLTITSLREGVIDFSKPFMSLGISIMIKKITKETPGVFSFMYPLSYEIWMCVIFAYIGVSVVLFLVSRFSPFEWHIEDNSDGPTVTNNFTIFNSLWFSLGAFMQQGCDIEPRSMSGRIVGSVWWFFTLIIISSYTANLAAFLTVERMQSPIESADDLAKQTEIKYGTVESGSTKEFFRTSTIPVYERMWAFMSSAEPSVFVDGNEDGVARVRESNGRYAFLAESTTNDYINQRKPCDTMKVGSNLDSKGYGIGTPLGSEVRDRITLAVLELRETGELAKLEKKWWYDKGECGKEASTKKGDTTNALKLMNVAGIFYILVGGLLLGLGIAFLEFMYKSKVEAKRRKTSFTNAVRAKARLSIKGRPERQTTAVGAPPEVLPPHMSMSTYTYAPAAQLISLDGYADTNTHTQV